MGLFSGLLGNASKKDNDKVERQLEGIESLATLLK